MPRFALVLVVGCLLIAAASSWSPKQVVDVTNVEYTFLTPLGTALLFVSDVGNYGRELWYQFPGAKPQVIDLDPTPGQSGLPDLINPFKIYVIGNYALLQNRTGYLVSLHFNNTTPSWSYITPNWVAHVVAFGSEALFTMGELLYTTNGASITQVPGISNMNVMSSVECNGGVYFTLSTEAVGPNGESTTLVFWTPSTGVQFGTSAQIGDHLTCVNGTTPIFLYQQSGATYFAAVDSSLNVTVHSITFSGADVSIDPMCKMFAYQNYVYLVARHVARVYFVRYEPFINNVTVLLDNSITEGYLQVIGNFMFYKNADLSLAISAYNLDTGEFDVTSPSTQAVILPPLQTATLTLPATFIGWDKYSNALVSVGVVSANQTSSSVALPTEMNTCIDEGSDPFFPHSRFYSDPSDPHHFTYDNTGALIVVAWRPESGAVIVRWNGSDFEEFADVQEGPQYSSVEHYITLRNGVELFVAVRSDVGRELFYLDSSGQLQLLNDSNPGCLSTSFQRVNELFSRTLWKDEALFVATISPSGDWGVFRTNGTAAGTQIINANPGSASGGAAYVDGRYGCAMSEYFVYTIQTWDMAQMYFGTFANPAQPGPAQASDPLCPVQILACNEKTAWFATRDFQNSTGFSAMYSATAPNSFHNITLAVPSPSIGLPGFTKGDLLFVRSYLTGLLAFNSTHFISTSVSSPQASLNSIMTTWNATHFVCLRGDQHLYQIIVTDGFTHTPIWTAKPEWANYTLDIDFVKGGDGILYFLPWWDDSYVSNANVPYYTWNPRTNVVQERSALVDPYLPESHHTTRLAFWDADYLYFIGGSTDNLKDLSRHLISTGVSSKVFSIVEFTGDYTSILRLESGYISYLYFYDTSNQHVLVPLPPACSNALHCGRYRDETSCSLACGADNFCYTDAPVLCSGSTICDLWLGECVTPQACTGTPPEPAEYFQCINGFYQMKGKVVLSSGQRLYITQQILMSGDISIPPNTTLYFDLADGGYFNTPEAAKRAISAGIQSVIAVNGALDIDGDVVVKISESDVIQINNGAIVGPSTQTVPLAEATSIASPVTTINLEREGTPQSECRKDSSATTQVEATALGRQQLNGLFTVDSTNCNLGVVVGVPVAAFAALSAVVITIVILKVKKLRNQVAPFKDSEI